MDEYLFGNFFWKATNSTNLAYDPKLDKDVIIPNRATDWSTLGTRSDNGIVFQFEMGAYTIDI